MCSEETWLDPVRNWQNQILDSYWKSRWWWKFFKGLLFRSRNVVPNPFWDTHTMCVKHTPKSEKVAFNLCQAKCYLSVCLLESAGCECRTSGSLVKEHPTAWLAHESQLCRGSLRNKWNYKSQLWKCNFAGLLDGKPFKRYVSKECSVKFEPPSCSPCGHSAVTVSMLKKIKCEVRLLWDLLIHMLMGEVASLRNKHNQ